MQPVWEQQLKAALAQATPETTQKPECHKLEQGMAKIMKLKEEEIKLKEKLLDEARNQSLQVLEKEKELQERQLKKNELKDAKVAQELAQYEGQIAKKDQQIKQLQDSITQLENGLNQITDEAKNVI